MPKYKRNFIPGGTFFFTVVTHNHVPWLCSEVARAAPRDALRIVRKDRPLVIDSWVLLPDHIHAMWTLPDGDQDYSVRWRLIKTGATKRIGRCFPAPQETSRKLRKEGMLWQSRFWEHIIRNDDDFAAHCDYIHYNSVGHGLCASPQEWPYSTFQRFMAAGSYAENWGRDKMPSLVEGTGME